MIYCFKSGKRVKLACLNWYGAHFGDPVVNGLDRAPAKMIVENFKSLGFNCIRLTYALDTIYQETPIKPERVSNNTELVGKTPFEVLDFVVQTMTDSGIMVILNNHVSKLVCSMFCKNWQNANM